MGLLDGFLTQLATGDTVKDYTHASKLFVGDNFRLAPKQGYLYHVFFDLDPSLTRMGRDQQIESGMLVKSVDLPKFTMDTKTLNSYNKPNIVQSKVKYDQLNVVFHDDHADVVRDLWFDYYHYYYRDADLGYSDKAGTVNPNYYTPTKYGDRTNNNYGYSPRNYSSFTSGAGSVQQYIKAIRIYSLHQKRFSEYTLVNPIITSFKHGQHQAGQADPMSHEMTISYEFVLYASGNVSKNTVKGFADIHYDHSPSPLKPAGGGTRSIVGPGGMVDTADEVINDLSNGNYASAAFKSLRGLDNLKNMNLKQAAGAELSQFGMDILRGNNPLNRISIPNMGNLAGGIATSLGTAAGNRSAAAPGAVTSNGAGAALTAAAATSGVLLSGLGKSVPAVGAAFGLLSAGGLLLGSGALNKLININPSTGQADGVSTLPTPAPTFNAARDSQAAYVQVADAAAAASSQNVASTAASLASSTSTPPQLEMGPQLTTPPLEVTSVGYPATTADAIMARSEELQQNPAANLNDDRAVTWPTDQSDTEA